MLPKIYLLISLLPFILLLIRREIDRRIHLSEHFKWAEEHLAGKRRVVGELFERETNHFT